jgi:ABC-type molybdate transport system substrate-binding protein
MIRQATIWLAASLLIPFSARAQDAKLIEAAKKEGGKVVAYGSLESASMDPIAQAFEKKTGIQVEYFRASAT